MLDAVKASSDGATMVPSDQWINVPVGNNLYDHVGVRLPFVVALLHSSFLLTTTDRY